MGSRVSIMLELKDAMTARLKAAGSAVRGFASDAKSSVSSLDSFTGGVIRSGQKVGQWFGDKASAAMSKFFSIVKIGAALGFAALTSQIYGSVTAATTFQATLRNTTGLLTGSGATSAMADAAYQNFNKQVLALAPKLAKTPQDLANSLYDIVSSGFTGNDATTVLAAAGKGASAGVTDTATVANALVRTMSAYGQKAKEAKKDTDVMFQGVNIGILNFQEMSTGLSQVIGLAAAAKVPFDQLVGAVALLTRKGLEAPEAFTSLNQMLLGIMAPSPQSQQAAESIFGADWKKKWSAQAVAGQGLAGVMKNLMKVLNPSPEQIKNLNSMDSTVSDLAASQIAGDKIDVLTSLFGNVRALRGALILASSSGYTFSDVMKDMQKSGGATDRVFAEQEKTFGRQKDRLAAIFDVLKISVGSGLLPELGDQFKSVSGWLEKVINSPEFANGSTSDKLKAIGSAISSWWGTSGGKIIASVEGFTDRIGSKVWNGITHWWKAHESEISSDMGAFGKWLQNSAAPAVTGAAFELGKLMLPAIFKGMMASPVGQLALVGLITKIIAGTNAFGISGSLLPSLSGGATAASSAAGATTAGATQAEIMASTSFITQMLGIILPMVILYLAGHALLNTYDKTKASVKTDADAAAKRADKMTTGQLQAAIVQQNAASTMSKAADWLSSHIFGTKTPKGVEQDALTKKNALIAQQTGQQLQTTGLIDLPSLSKTLNANLRKNLGKNLAPGPGLNTNPYKDNVPQKVIDAGKVNGFDVKNLSALLKAFDDPTTRKYLKPEVVKSLEDTLATGKTTADKMSTTAAFVIQMGGTAADMNTALDNVDPTFQKLGGKSLAWGLTMASAMSQTDQAILLIQAGAQKLVSQLKGNMVGYGDQTPGGADNLTPTSYFGYGRGGQVPGPLTMPKGSTPNYGPTKPKPIPGNGHVGPHSSPMGDTIPTKIPLKGAYARGGSGMVYKPTLFLAGEAGAEHFNFAPASGPAGHSPESAGTSVTVQGPLIGKVEVQKESDVDDIVDQLVTKLEQRIANGV